MTGETAVEEALRSRADLRSAETSVQAAALSVRAQKAQRLPVISVTADYGGAGANIGNFNQVYTVAGNISVPIYIREAESMRISSRRRQTWPAAKRSMKTQKAAVPTTRGAHAWI